MTVPCTALDAGVLVLLLLFCRCFKLSVSHLTIITLHFKIIPYGHPKSLLEGLYAAGTKALSWSPILPAREQKAVFNKQNASQGVSFWSRGGSGTVRGSKLSLTSQSGEKGPRGGPGSQLSEEGKGLTGRMACSFWQKPQVRMQPVSVPDLQIPSGAPFQIPHQSLNPFLGTSLCDPDSAAGSMTSS